VDHTLAYLPQEPNRFIGREHELAELRGRLRQARALTLCGPGGIGKTRLALRVLAAAADEFPDGTWFVELADLRQPDLVASRVAAALGVSEEAGRPLLDTLADALRPRRMVLTLDNCEHLIDACAHLGRRLLTSSPGLRLLNTSREPLRIAAETVWTVPPLSVAAADAERPTRDSGHDEAVQLFADRAAAAQPGFALDTGNAAVIAAICRALDGVPLAIELAAARVRVLSPEQITARMGDRFGLLTAGDRSAAPRQQTLRATIEWSYELLAPAERILFRRLSVFAGWSLDMAEQVCADDGIPAPEVLGLIAALVDKSLVAPEAAALGQARYRMLDTIREYAAERLADAGEADPFQRRFRDYSLTTAEHNGAIGMARVPASWPARVDALRRYDAEAGNVARVLSWCLEHGDAETGLRVCTAVSPCWIVWGTFAEGREWLDSFLALDVSGVPAGVRGAALVVRAQLALPSDPAAAGSLVRTGLELCRTAGDQFWTAVALNLCTEIALHTGRTEEAAASADEALAAERGGSLRGGVRAAEFADSAGARDCGPDRYRAQQQGHRRRAVHQSDHRGSARGQHPGQAGLQVTHPDRRVDGRPAIAGRRSDLGFGEPWVTKTGHPGPPRGPGAPRPGREPGVSDGPAR
jgi:predicted ATPase